MARPRPVLAARRPAGPGGVAADEALEQRRLELGRDAGPVVGHAQLDRARRLAGASATVTTVSGGRVLGRVAQQVGQHLVQPVLVAGDHDRLVRQFEQPAVAGRRRPGRRWSRRWPAGSGRPGRWASGRPASSRASSSRSSTSTLIRADSDSTRLQGVLESAGPGRAGAGRARRSRGWRPAGCAARGWRRRRSGAAAPRWLPRRASADSTWPSIRLNATPTWPTSVRGIGVAGPARRSVDLAAGQRQLGDLGWRWRPPGAAGAATAARTRCRAGRSAISAAPKTTTSVSCHVRSGRLHRASGSPVMSVSPSWRGAGDQPVVAERRERDRSGCRGPAERR